jgi:hypothetical protein
MKFGTLKRGLVVASGSIALACSAPSSAPPQTAAPTPLSIEQRFAKATPAALAGQDGYRAVAESLRAIAPLKFGTLTDETGGAVARDVVMLFGDNLDAGLKISEMRVYGAGAGGAVAARIELRGVASFGLAGLSEKMLRRQFGGMLDVLPDAAKSVDMEAELESASTISRHDMGAALIAIDGLRLAAPAPAKPVAEKKGVLALFSGYEFLRDVAFDALMVRDWRGELDTGAGAARQSSAFEMGAMSAAGFRGGDFDLYHASAIHYEAKSPLSPGQGAVDFVYDVAGFEMRGVRFARMLAALRDGALPPSGETDIISLGVMRMFGEKASVGGAPLYSAGETEVDMRKFHWLAPTHIRARGEDVVYHADGFMKLAGQPGDVKTASRFAVLSRRGLLPVRLDYDFAYDWTPQTGALSIASSYASPALFDWSMSFDGGTEPFDALVAQSKAIGEGGGARTALGAASALRMARFETKIADKGLLTAGFAAAADLQAVETEAPEGTFDPDEIRAGAALAMRAGAAKSPFAALAAAIADFIAGGGTLTIVAAPPAPLALSELGAGGDPVATLGLSARRDPPGAE